MQNDNVNPNPAGSQQPASGDTGVQANTAPQTANNPVTEAAKQQVEATGAQVQNQVQDLGKQASQQISNLGQSGVNQLGGAMGKMLKPDEQKANQPPVKQDEKIYATIAYIPFVAILSIIIKPDSAFVRLHSKQGLLLSILFFFVGILAAIVALFGVIGQFLAFVLGLVPLACLIIAVYSMYLTFNGYWWKIPVLSALADLIPIEAIAKTSKENITGQVGIAKTDYDNRQDTLKSEKTENSAAVAADVQQNVPAATAEVKPAVEQKNDTNTGAPDAPKSN